MKNRGDKEENKENTKTVRRTKYKPWKPKDELFRDSEETFEKIQTALEQMEESSSLPAFFDAYSDGIKVHIKWGWVRAYMDADFPVRILDLTDDEKRKILSKFQLSKNREDQILANRDKLLKYLTDKYTDTSISLFAKYKVDLINLAQYAF